VRVDVVAALATDAVGHTTTAEAVVFWLLGAVAVVGAIGVVSAPKAVYSAMFLASTMIALAVLYIAQDALFLGIVQVVVYTGAVMMLFLFVLMLIGVDLSESFVETIRGQRIAALAAGVGFGVLLIAGIGNVSVAGFTGLAQANAGGNVEGLAALIFTKYLWAFELTGALLITAALGAMMLAHRERLLPKVTQAELSRHRIKDGPIKAPLPAPGVFARHNAVDTPALLPDGTPSELSVSRVLTARGQNRPVSLVTDDVAVLVSELNSPLGELGYADGPIPDDAPTAEDAPPPAGETVLEGDRS
jgi:NADH-quinone oxidoreductase subunit J